MKKQKNKYEEWEYSIDEIDYALDCARDLIPYYARIPLAKALSLLPRKIIDFVVNNCIFISPEAESKGYWYSFNHPFFKGKKGFILLGDILWKAKPIERAFVIAHEVAHAFKGHNVLMTEISNVEKQMKMEVEADKLAIKWLVKHYKEKSLLKISKEEEKERQEKRV